MKKFSKITNQKVNEAPKNDKDVVNEQDIFKHQVLKLMDDFLKVQMYGPITRYHVAGTMKVVGKELFLEALMNLLKEKIAVDKVKLLEDLKFNLKDWVLIDDVKNEIISESIFDDKILKHKDRVKSLYRIYSDDKDMLLLQTEKVASKIKNGYLAWCRGLAAKDMINEKEYNRDYMLDMSRIFFDRASKLGYSYQS